MNAQKIGDQGPARKPQNVGMCSFALGSHEDKINTSSLTYERN